MMLYYDLAQSFCELDKLIELSHKLRLNNPQEMEVIDQQFLNDEVSRVKRRAAEDILFFGRHAHYYFVKNLSEIQRMLVCLLDLLNALPDFCFMTEQEKVLYRSALILKNELAHLSAFFTELRMIYEAPKE